MNASNQDESGLAEADTRAAGSADLDEQVAKLRQDVAGVAESLKALASGGADTARVRATALRDDVRDRSELYLRQARDAASDLEEQLSERIRSEPVKAVLAAAAIGYLYARLFRS